MITIADLCPYWSWPTTGGGPLRVYNINKTVAEQVQVLQFSARPTLGHQQYGWAGWIGARSQQLTEHYWEYQYFHPAILGAGYLLYKLGLHSDIFLSSMLHYLNPIALQKIINAASIIQVEHPWLFELASRVAHGKPIIYVAHNIEAALWEHTPKDKRTPFKALSRRPRELERKAAQSADAVVCMSEQDAETLINDYSTDPERIYIIPNGVDLQACKPPTPEEKAAARKHLGLNGNTVLLFTGSDHYPNKEALAQIKKWQAQLGPNLNVQFVIAGTVGRGVRSTDYMQVVGYVDDISEYLQAADIALNPLTSGSGTSLKVVEYLGYGLPTITTRTGIRGLNFIPGRDVLLGEVQDFPTLITNLLKDKKLCKQLSQHGFRTVTQAYGWDQLGKRMLDIYERIAPCACA